MQSEEISGRTALQGRAEPLKPEQPPFSIRITMYLATQPDICANRHRSSEESMAAFERIASDLPEKRAEVLRAIAGYESFGLTCKELAAAQGVGMNVISGRFTELKKDGLIRKTGVRNGSAIYIANTQSRPQEQVP